jgi:hypothetical protein
MEGLPDPDVWKCMELFQGNLAMHSFYACRGDRPERSFRIDWDAAGRLKRAVPHLRHGARIESERPPVAVGRQGLRIELDAVEHALLKGVDGRRTAGACLRRLGPDDAAGGLLALRRLWRMGLVLLELR